MIVRLGGNIVAEIFPEEFQTIEDIAHWYSQEYAEASVEAPEDVKTGMAYDPATGGFWWPPEPEPEGDVWDEIAKAIDEGVLSRDQ